MIAHHWNLFWNHPRLAIAGLVILTVVTPVGLFAYWQHQTPGLVAAALALLTCGIGVVVARLVGMLLLPGPAATNYRMLFGMLIRMAVPLLLCMVVVLEESPLLQYGFAYYLLIFYQLLLVIDVYWSIVKLKTPLAS
ncbi:MAG: hypothetical protein QF408_07285 [Pirellulales bacterium]|nr:hypothetical protein [Pirellulales bacterium]